MDQARWAAGARTGHIHQMPRWLKRWIARIPRWESRLAFADWVWRGASFLVVVAVSWWTAARAWVESLITPYGTLGYVIVALFVAAFITLILMGVAWAVDRFRAGRTSNSSNGSLASTSEPCITSDYEPPDSDPAPPIIETNSDRAAKHDLAVFVAEHVIPTFEA